MILFVAGCIPVIALLGIVLRTEKPLRLTNKHPSFFVCCKKKSVLVYISCGSRLARLWVKIRAVIAFGREDHLVDTCSTA